MSHSLAQAARYCSIVSFAVILLLAGCGGDHAPAAWRTAQQIENSNPGDAELPQIAIEASGNALAVWQQSDGTRTNIWSNRYIAGTGWGTAELIETNNEGDAKRPHIAIDASGNALAVWDQSDGTRYNVWSNRYIPGTGWDTAQLIQTNNAENGHAAQVAMNAVGNAQAIWFQFDGVTTNIWANRYTAGTGWGTAQLIETDDVGQSLQYQIAIDSSGNVLAVWTQYDGTRYNIWSNRYIPGTGWGTAQLIETANEGDALVPQIAFDTSGNALTVWAQYDDTRVNIWSNRYVKGIGWGTAQLIEADEADAFDPQIAIDASGNALVTWNAGNSTLYDIKSNRYVADTGWGIPQIVKSNNAISGSLDLAIDASGNARAIWVQYDGTYGNIWSNRYEAGTGWATAQRIETDIMGEAYVPQIAMNASGRALAVWYQSGGTHLNIWSKLFD
jgi:hypothetical protein